MDIVFLLVGLLLTALGVFLIVDERRFRRRARRIPGTVAAILKHRPPAHDAGAGDGGRRRQRARTMFYPVVAYVDDGVTREFVGRTGSGTVRHRIGQRVWVLDPPQPEVPPRIDGRAAGIFGTIFAMSGIGCVALFLHLYEWTPVNLAISAGVLLILAVQGVWWLRRSGVRSAREAGTRLAEANRRRIAQGARLTSMREVAAERTAIHASGRWSGPTFAVLGLAMLMGAYHLGLAREVFLLRARPATGEVVDLAPRDEWRDGRSIRVWAPVVRYRPSATAEARTFTGEAASTHPAWREGATVPVLYDPGDPARAIIDGGWRNRAGIWALGGLGLLFVVAGLDTWRRARRYGACKSKQVAA